MFSSFISRLEADVSFGFLCAISLFNIKNRDTTAKKDS